MKPELKACLRVAVITVPERQSGRCWETMVTKMKPVQLVKDQVRNSFSWWGQSKVFWCRCPVFCLAKNKNPTSGITTLSHLWNMVVVESWFGSELLILYNDNLLSLMEPLFLIDMRNFDMKTFGHLSLIWIPRDGGYKGNTSNHTSSSTKEWL